MTDMARLGSRIREARIVRGMLQEELAEKAGIDQAQLSRYERGAVTPRIKTIQVIAAALDVSYAWLITGRQE